MYVLPPSSKEFGSSAQLLWDREQTLERLAGDAATAKVRERCCRYREQLLGCETATGISGAFFVRYLS
ncbi:uncharacterized protein SETTUDRAFT_169383 [Exserohilum turcica Et28A]|uniref:Uncharacterized protein n=1 Tax=Exserohilum turcicum (strain 28A) TaxID=671987 RepID=R0K998_EXST2|nr:uncharacterized protein SETTUDRAFT_169383 [Exserohilum turcica Et28A]EOA86014.1 hypothetical protein SETTUDRAFT_169383 [Exserohilum turcica Et28A]